ncbi:RNA polymerase sigma factor [Sphingomonas sanxanigenens]|uniref:RNA polymerase sigma factor n=1 Tax=Sphingomonas sanxanigenens TaxID=397260 RepID=UPI003CCBECDB
MRRHRESIYRLIRGHIGDPEEAIHLTQDCFSAAFQHLGSYDGSRPLRAWLTSVAINSRYQQEPRLDAPQAGAANPDIRISAAV